MPIENFMQSRKLKLASSWIEALIVANFHMKFRMLIRPML
jgi:hypothetical protein